MIVPRVGEDWISSTIKSAFSIFDTILNKLKLFRMSSSFLTQRSGNLKGTNKVDAPLGNLVCHFPTGGKILFQQSDNGSFFSSYPRKLMSLT